LNAGFVDSFRHLYPSLAGAYSWWSYRYKARETNAGWRIDYFVVSDSIKQSISDANIYSNILGSDHCPVGLSIDI
ncbi:MAG: exodeoxyribonuclease III, partial [Oscillospiraceae bacterium]